MHILATLNLDELNHNVSCNRSECRQRNVMRWSLQLV